MLTLSKVTRSEMGAYLCIAANGVPPSVSKRMMLHVHCKYINKKKYIYFKQDSGGINKIQIEYTTEKKEPITFEEGKKKERREGK